MGLRAAFRFSIIRWSSSLATRTCRREIPGRTDEAFAQIARSGSAAGAIVDRRDKMGFPVPMKEWFGGGTAGIRAGSVSLASRPNRAFFNSKAVLANFDKAGPFSRKTGDSFRSKSGISFFTIRQHGSAGILLL